MAAAELQIAVIDIQRVGATERIEALGVHYVKDATERGGRLNPHLNKLATSVRASRVADTILRKLNSDSLTAIGSPPEGIGHKAEPRSQITDARAGGDLTESNNVCSIAARGEIV